MPDFPDPNLGGLDPHPAVKRRTPLGRRIRIYSLLLLICGILVGMAIAGGFWMRAAFRPGLTWDDRLYTLIVSLGLFTPLFIAVSVYIRSKWKTGRWVPQRGASVNQTSQCSTRAYPIRQIPWIQFAWNWATHSAMDPSCAPSQRLAGWVILVMYAIAMLVLTALGVICCGAAFADDNTVTATLIFIALGLFILIFPALGVRKLIRDIRSGKIGATREDLDQMRAQRDAWQLRESQKPLRSKILTTAFAVGVYGLLWLRITGRHSPHAHETWITPAMSTPFLIYSIWIQFRKPKTPPPQTDTDN